MLQSLHVHNFALLEDASVDFSSGFNVFTGETGAGKSILIDAFGTVLGSRASVDYIRNGTDEFWVQAVFDISGIPELKTYLSRQGMETDEELFLKRQFNATGKSKAFANGVQIPLSMLRQIGEYLVDIHGQHENQVLLQEDSARLITDAFGSREIKNKVEYYAKCYENYLFAKNELAKLTASKENRELLLDRYKWEINEILNADLKPGEKEALEDENNILQNSEKIINALGSAHELLDNENMVLGLLGRVKTNLQNAGKYDEKLLDIASMVDSAWITLDDCRQEINKYLCDSDFNSGRINAVQEKLDTISRLEKKYGGSVVAVLAYLDETRNKYEELLNIEKVIARMEKELAVNFKQLQDAADKLSEARKESAARLSDLITEHIHDLAMSNGIFNITVTRSDDFAFHGRDVVKFMFSANMGEPVNEMEKVASGGELSRIALAIKTVMMNANSVPTMVFDEIDSGVGGVTAWKMAEKISIISKVGQVICLTHLPQIAAFADRHIYIEKLNTNGRTVTILTALDRDERIMELMRMAGAVKKSKAAYNNASELLCAAEARKTERLF
ncbi:MAG: DNA repair protein RecN [Phascolarctobacterium sp.]|nr:DNA repair protein RecN [Phascolarctobacterium sp.]